MGRSQRPEIADVRIEWPLRVVEPGGKFGHEKVDVGVALAVRMGRFIDRHVVDEGREIGAVVEVEAADEILVRFAFAGMNGHHQARHRLQHLPDAIGGPQVDLLLGDRSLAGGCRGSEQIDPRAHFDGRQGFAGCGRVRGRGMCRGLRWRVGGLRRWQAGSSGRQGKAGEQGGHPMRHADAARPVPMAGGWGSLHCILRRAMYDNL